ncbi:MAG TPA: hypothetical protein VNL77_06120 [Roseiflexaceae bacterium]|nr:hypothetical protein [Roseiflexaceae bacterium]
MARTITHAALAVLLALALAPAAAQNSGERCFPETGHCISGAIREYWERNGGLAVFGYPIGPQQIETVEGVWRGPVQWFERDRLEDHANEGLGVLAGRLGARFLELQERPWQMNEPLPAPPRGCVQFPETGYRLCEPFLSYWRRNGGLARFGFPISPVMEETLPLGGGRTWRGEVQYFERRRMEHHPENPARHRVLLGLLGRDVRGIEQGGSPCLLAAGGLQRHAEAERARLGCPVDLQSGTAVAQLFEGGLAVWVPASESTRSRLYLVTRDAAGALRWSEYGTGGPSGAQLGETPPAGRFAPGPHVRQLWASDPQVRRALGWATIPEQQVSGTLARFARGGRMMQVAGTPRVFVLFPDGRVEELAGS